MLARSRRRGQGGGLTLDDAEHEAQMLGSIAKEVKSRGSGLTPSLAAHGWPLSAPGRRCWPLLRRSLTDPDSRRSDLSVRTGLHARPEATFKRHEVGFE